MCTGTPIDEKLLGSYLPANARMLLRSVSSKTPKNDLVKEDAFRADEINALRIAVTNSQKRVHSLSDEQKRNLNEMLAQLKNMPPKQPLILGTAEWHKKRIGEIISPTIQYGDYQSVGKDFYTKSPLLEFNNPNYSMATTIGRAKYQPDDNGNLHVQDTYDFNGSDEFKRKSLVDKLSSTLKPVFELDASLPYMVARKAAAQFANPMQMDIQLQHGANGEW